MKDLGMKENYGNKNINIIYVQENIQGSKKSKKKIPKFFNK